VYRAPSILIIHYSCCMAGFRPVFNSVIVLCHTHPGFGRTWNISWPDVDNLHIPSHVDDKKS
jgi:hypothetical protein